MAEFLTPLPSLERPGGRQAYVDTLFAAAAPHYDWICGAMSLGSGQFYRRWSLRQAGLRPGMRLLDVGTGTGLVARAAIQVVGAARDVIGLDPNRGMLTLARARVAGALLQGRAEALPFPGDRFDMVAMGYALRHVADLGVVFREYLRVLRPGGRLLMLEISRPRSRAALWAIRVYLERMIPLIARLGTGSLEAERLMRYYWETIAECVPPETILDALERAGFAPVERRVYGGVLSEYRARKPGPHRGA